MLPSNISSSQDIKSGIKAYDQGDFARALTNFMPLADIDTDYTQLRISENNPITKSLAQYYLSLMYCHGRGVTKNRLIALDWLNKSRRGGNILAEKARCEKHAAP